MPTRRKSRSRSRSRRKSPMGMGKEKSLKIVFKKGGKHYVAFDPDIIGKNLMKHLTKIENNIEILKSDGELNQRVILNEFQVLKSIILDMMKMLSHD